MKMVRPEKNFAGFRKIISGRSRAAILLRYAGWKRVREQAEGFGGADNPVPATSLA
jgi:hypothetical protein